MQTKEKVATKGLCGFCESEIDKSRMTQHLKSCKQRATANAAYLAGNAGQKQRLFHILAEGKYNPQYWMHFEVVASEPLETLDSFLRDAWVECCDHLSAFKIDGTVYEDERELDFSFPPEAAAYEEGEEGADEEEEYEEEDADEVEEEDYEDLSPEEMAEAVGEILDVYVKELSVKFPPELEAELRKPRARGELVAFLREKLKALPGRTYRYSLTDREEQRSLYFQEHIMQLLLSMVEDRSLGVPLEKVLSVGQKFTYEYDYGSTTYINLRVISEREGALSKGEDGEEYVLDILARNVAPVMLCNKCGKPATKVAAGYYNVEENAYCDECAGSSEEADMMLPIVNSPRVGVCGYTG
jgi:hypothetical protein